MLYLFLVTFVIHIGTLEMRRMLPTATPEMKTTLTEAIDGYEAIVKRLFIVALFFI